MKTDLFTEAYSLKGLGRILAKESRARFSHDAFLFALYEEDNRTLKVVYAEDTIRDNAGPEEVKSGMLVGRELSPTPSLINRDIAPAPVSLEPFGQVERPSQSLMFAPILWDGRIIGTISVQSYAPSRYDGEDLKQLAAMADASRVPLARLRAEVSEQRLSKAIEHGSSLIFITDRWGQIEYANRRYLEVTGYRMDEVVGRRPRLLRGNDHPDGGEIWERLTEGGNWQGELMHPSSDGRQVWVLASISPILDEEGDVTHYLVVQEDITERKEADAAVKRSQSILHAVAFAAEAFLHVRDWEKALPDVLQSLGAAAGSHRVFLWDNMIRGRDVFTRFRAEWNAEHVTPLPPDVACRAFSYEERGMQEWMRLLSTGEAVAGPVEELPAGALDLMKAHGIRSLLMVPVFAGTAWWGSLAICDNVKPRRWTENEIDAMRAAASILGAAITRGSVQLQLKESESRGKLFLNSPFIMSVLLDRDGRVITINEAMATSIGMKRDAAVGQDFFSLFRPEIASRRRIYFEQVLLSGEPIRYQDSREGHFFDVSINPSLNADGQVDHVAVFAQDVTTARRNERLAALGLTASGIAHYIKNVQTSLTGATQMMDYAIRNFDRAVLEQTWPIVRRSTDRINHLVKNMLALSRDPVVVGDFVNVNDLILEVLDDSRELAEEFGVVCEHQLDDALPSLRVDPTRFYDVILNLVINSVEALAETWTEDRRVTISTSYSSETMEAVVVVCDNGPGIPQAVRHRLFEPFFTTKGTRGTGLGLSVVRKFVEEVSGDIEVDLAPGGGAQFRLKFPLLSREGSTEKARDSAV